MLLKQKLKLRWYYLSALLVVLIFTSLIKFLPIFESKLTQSAFSEFKSYVEKESAANRVSANCSHQYGTELIQNWRRGQINICSGFGKSKLSCHVNNENRANRIFCTAENAIIDLNNLNATREEKITTLMVDCNLGVYRWIPNGLWFHPMRNISRIVELNCHNYVNHTVFWLYRYDFQNPYHILEDIVTTFESLLILEHVDPANIELIIYDNFPIRSVFHEVWSLIFGKGVRILGQNPFPDKTCFKNSIFSMEGGNSLLSGMGGINEYTVCTSPILRSLRKLFYKSVSIPERTVEKRVNRIGFLSRKQYDPTRTIGRIILLEDEMLEVFKKMLPSNWELVILRPELLKTFKETVEIFEELDILVGTHGAGLANVMFMRPGTGLVEIFFGDRDFRNRHYYNMCKWLGVRYYTPGYFENLINPFMLWQVVSQAITENVEIGK